jgi:signal transduction histidine kinase
MVAPTRAVLGLALASRAAHALGARIEVSSQIGKGTRFTLVLTEAWP